MTWQRLIRFTAVEDGKVYYGEPEQSGDLGLLHHAHTTITARVLSSSPLDRSASLTPRVLTVKKLLSPVDPRDVRTIRGLGAQFSALPKAERKQPEVPVLFLKPATAICGPEDSIFIPESARGESNDYEVEVCVVMGKQAKDVSVAEAMDYVLGFCTSNDVSSRGLCGKGLQWGVGKSYDTWCPLGPALIAPSAIKDVQNLKIRTTVNGVTKQEASTSDMVFSIAELISLLSRGSTIEAGSIILSGTPLPLNRAADKEPFLKHGDEVRVFVEGCGTLINTVVEENGPKVQAKL